jgi:putative hydrolase
VGDKTGSSRPTEQVRFERFDFHSHTFLTDGATSATEMWRQAEHLDHRALAVTDHIGLEDPRPLLQRLREEARGWEGTPLIALIGVEVTHVRPSKIEQAVRAARSAGAEIVIVHGETLAEEVAPGTNRAALELPEVDVLAHPGLLTVEEAELARAHGTILELSGRRGHSLANGRVARVALEVGASLCVDSDAHDPSQLLAARAARRIAEGAGLQEDHLQSVLEEAPRKLLRRVGRPC